MAKNMRVMLCNPYFPRKVKGAPLSLLYLAGSLKHRTSGFKGEVCLLDLNITNGPDKELADGLKGFKPTHFGITRFTPNASESANILAKVKEYDERIVTITGGAHEITYGSDSLRRLGKTADHIVCDFDGIEAFQRILGAGSGLHTLDILPDYGLILQNKEKYQFDDLFNRPMTQMITSTGCNCACSFCGVKALKLGDLGVVMRNIEHIVSLGYGAIVFDDGNFIGDKNRTLELARRIKEGGLCFDWSCQTRADSVDEEVLDAMKGSGCTYICTALESADSRVLKAISKKLGVSDVIRAVDLIKKSGMKVGLYVIFGHPLEISHPEIAVATLDMVETLRPDFLSVSIFARYRGVLPMEDVNREKDWLYFDEGWGAHHDASLAYAIKTKEMIEERIGKKPEIWDSIKRF